MLPPEPPKDQRVSLYKFRVGYVDTDQAGVMHHAAYLRYLEFARVDFIREGGLSYSAFELAAKRALPVIEVHTRYRLPARYDEELTIHTWVGELSRAKLRFDSIIRTPPDNARVLHFAQVTVACVSMPDGHVTSIPQQIRDALV